MLKVAIAAGGTGGHIFPGIAIAEEFIKQIDSVRILFIGAKNGIENKIVPKYNFTIFQTDVRKLHRRLTTKNLLFPFHLLRSRQQVVKILRDTEVDIVIGCGGFVSGSVGLAARKLHIPIFLQEQNSFPGISTRLLAKSCKKIYLGNPEAARYIKCSQSNLMFTGNPIRKFKVINKKTALTYWKLENKPVIFIYGGSQGSHSINQTFSEIIENVLDNNIQIIFQTGERDFEVINRKFGERKGVVIRSFFDNIDYAYASSDLVVCRAGATSLSEISYFGLPAIIIPFPYSAGNHQLKNARYFQSKGAAEIITEDELNSKMLLKRILELIINKNSLIKMSEATKKLAVPDSAEIIVQDITHICKEEKIC